MEGSKNIRQYSLKYWQSRCQILQMFKNVFHRYLGQSGTFYDLQVQYIEHLIDKKNLKKNQIICGPTGSGKTFVFIMKILNSLKSKPKNAYSKFKCIYIAPSKAICQQKYQQFNQNIGKDTEVGLQIIYLSSQLSSNVNIYQQFIQNQIIICTPQMAMKIIKKMKFQPIFQILDLLLIDEIHLIACEQRGLFLQIILNRAINTQKSNKKLQISCMSASIPNITQIEKWLNAKIISSPVKPVPIKFLPHFQSYFNNIQQYSGKNKLFNQLPQVIKRFQQQFDDDYRTNQLQIKKNQNYLIFCTTKRQSKKKCLQFLQIMSKQKHKQLYDQCCKRNQPNIQLYQVETQIQTIKDNQQLCQCLINRFAYHNSTLTQQQKQIVLKLFKNGWIIFLFSTSTLAQGVNLSVKTVIIMDVFKWNQYYESLKYTGTQLDQMTGRAGRNKKDHYGYFTILGRSNTVLQLFQYYDKNQRFQLEELKSNLMDNINNVIFFQVCYMDLYLTNDKDYNKLHEYLMQSLYAIQYVQNKMDENCEQKLKQKFQRRLDRAKRNFNKLQLDIEQVRYHIFDHPNFNYNDFVKLYIQISNGSVKSQQDFLRIFSSLESIQQVIRYQQEDGLAELRKKIDMPFKTNFQLKKQRIISKIILLLHIYFSNQTQRVQDQDLISESKQIKNIFTAYCQLLNKMYFDFLKYRDDKRLKNPQNMFLQQIYLKYCQLNSSHYNFQKCWETLQMIQRRCANFYACIQNKKYNKNIMGFFSLLDKVLKQNINQTFLQVQQYQTRQIKTKFNQYKMQVTTQINQYIIRAKTYRAPINFFIFKKFAQNFEFYRQSKDLIKLQKTDENEYKILVIFQEVIGMDIIFNYKNGKIIEFCKINQLREQKQQKQNDLIDNKKDENMSQSQKQEIRQQQIKLQKSYKKQQQKNKRNKQMRKSKNISQAQKFIPKNFKKDKDKDEDNDKDKNKHKIIGKLFKK